MILRIPRVLKVDSVNSALNHARELNLRSILNLTSIKITLILSCLNDSVQGRRDSYFQAQALYLSLRTS